MSGEIRYEKQDGRRIVVYRCHAAGSVVCCTDCRPRYQELSTMKCIGKTLRQNWRDHRNRWLACQRCEFAKFRDRLVLGRGKLPADVLFIGEAPGKSEDTIGAPFVGPAGKLLQQWIDTSIQRVSAYDYAITNLVACRPTDRVGGNNRTPSTEEVRNCQPRLTEIMYMAQPKLVIAVGRVAEERLIGMMRECMALSATMAALQHPAYVLRVGGEGTDADKTNRDVLTTLISRMKRKRR